MTILVTASLRSLTTRHALRQFSGCYSLSNGSTMLLILQVSAEWTLGKIPFLDSLQWHFRKSIQHVGSVEQSTSSAIYVIELRTALFNHDTNTFFDTSQFRVLTCDYVVSGFIWPDKSRRDSWKIRKRVNAASYEQWRRLKKSLCEATSRPFSVPCVTNNQDISPKLNIDKLQNEVLLISYSQLLALLSKHEMTLLI